MNTTQLRFSRTAPHPADASHTCRFFTSLLAEGIEVAVDNKIIGTIPWADLANVDTPDGAELVAEIMWSLQVWEFRIVLEMLGDAVRKGGKALVE